MSVSLRGPVEAPALRLKRSRDRLRAQVRPTGKSQGCEVTTEWVMVSSRAIMLVSLATFRSLERTGLPSVLLHTLSATRDPCDRALVTCHKMDSMDRKQWPGLLEAGG